MAENQKNLSGDNTDEELSFTVDSELKNYRDSKTSAEENRSSGYVLLVVGVLGIVFLVLCFFGIIPLSFGNPYLFYGVLSAFFALFLVMGGLSIVNARKYESKAKSEKSVKDAIIEWTEKNLTADIIDSEIDDAKGYAEEALFFERSHIIAKKLNQQFVNLDPLFLEDLIDNTIYDIIYQE